MEPPNRVLLIIDVQEDFTGSNAKMPVDKNQADEIIANINHLLENSDKTGLIPVYIGNEFPVYSILNFFRNNAAIKGSIGTKMDHRLKVISNYYFPKEKNNAFSNPELGEFLKQKNIAELYITGLFAEGCIYGTIKGAIKNNYPVYVFSDCIASGSDERRDKMIGRYKKLGVKCLTVASFK